MEIFIAIVLGCLAGVVTGITPGIHINLVSILVLSASPFLLQFTSPIILAVFIVSMAVLHTFMNVIPSIFLGAPEADTALAVLPGHRLLLQGKGYEAVKLTVLGSLLGLIAIILLSPLLIVSVGKFYPLIKDYIGHILIVASVFLILKDRKSKLWALIIFLMAGVLGIGTLSLPLSQPLFPLLSGLFGTSMLVLSYKDKIRIPKQEITKAEISKKDTTKAISSGVIASMFCGLLPGIGAAQAAIIASSMLRGWTVRSFLVLVGSIDTIVMVLSFVALYTIDKARNGAVVVISKLLESFTSNNFILFVVCALIVAIIATILTLIVARFSAKLMTKINYQKLCLIIIALIIILVTILSGFMGLLVLVVATFVGMIAPLLGIGRNHMMGCLILPVILWFML